MGPGGIEISPWIMLGLVVLLWIKLGRKPRKKIEHVAWQVIHWTMAKIWFVLVLITFAIRFKIGLRLAFRLQHDRWDPMVETRKLKGLKRGWIKSTPAGISVRLHLCGSLRSRDVSARIGQIEAGLGIKRGTARVRPLSRADRADLEIVLRDPLSQPVPWTKPRGIVRLADLVRLSVTPFGDQVSLSMKQRIGIFGTSGSGKSVVQRNLAAHVIMSADAMLDLWDLKFGVESQHFEDKAYRVISVDQAWARVQWLINEEFPRRSEIMKKWGSSNWIESAEHPAMVIMIDEGNEIIRGFTEGQQEKFFRVAEQGRALGVYLVWATQFPKATNLPTELRSQLNAWITLQMLKAGESRVIFEDDVNEGWAPHRLKGKGWLLIKDDDHRVPDESRGLWLPEDQFRKIKTVGSLPPETGAVITAEPEAPASKITKPSSDDDVWAALAVADEPLTISELARRTGRSKSRVHGAIQRMIVNDMVIQTGGGYTLPINKGKNK